MGKEHSHPEYKANRARLLANKPNRLEPGMTIKHTQLAARPQAALAQAEGA